MIWIMNFYVMNIKSTSFFVVVQVEFLLLDFGKGDLDVLVGDDFAVVLDGGVGGFVGDVLHVSPRVVGGLLGDVLDGLLRDLLLFLRDLG